MSASVLIVATCYDVNTSYTRRWADRLHASLMSKGHTAFLLAADALCRSGPAFSDALARAEITVFLGHGADDRWIAMPAGRGASAAGEICLVETGDVSVLDGQRVYAACCSSLKALGPAFAGKCTGEFMGYDHSFEFEHANESEFMGVVTNSVLSYAGGANARAVAANLKADWDALRADFTSGRLMNRQNAAMAASAADANAQCVGAQP